ncbi:MAG: DUF4407 domain-containing protein [Chitinophagaceae bacterium]|nr:DUF4407 domain-containing protein [Chitinophagaceae bacterium]
MIKIACFLTGDNYSLLVTDTPASKKKVVALGIALMVPVLIWFLNGFLLSYMVLHTGLANAFLVATICAILIFATEKMILMANGNGWITFFRFFTGLVTALLGSIAIDEVVFKNDIDTEVIVLKEDRTEVAKKRAEQAFYREHNIAAMETAIQQAQAIYNAREKSAVDEADGSSGTGNKGIGEVTAFKNAKAQERKTQLLALQLKKDSLEVVKAAAIEKAAELVTTNFNPDGLLIRVEALFQLALSNPYMAIVYIAFTLLFLFLELLVVILKVSWKETNYERRLQFIEVLGAKRIEFFQSKHLAVADPGYYTSNSERAKLLLKTKKGLFD